MIYHSLIDFCHWSAFHIFYFVLRSMTEDFLCNQVILLNNCSLGQKNIDPVTLYDQLFLHVLESNGRNGH